MNNSNLISETKVSLRVLSILSKFSEILVWQKMENISSVRPTGKFQEKVENLTRQAHFPGWNFLNEISCSTCVKHVSCALYQFQLLPTQQPSWSPIGQRAQGHSGVYDQSEQLFTYRKIHFLFPLKFPDFLHKWKVS